MHSNLQTWNAGGERGMWGTFLLPLYTVPVCFRILWLISRFMSKITLPLQYNSHWRTDLLVIRLGLRVEEMVNLICRRRSFLVNHYALLECFLRFFFLLLWSIMVTWWLRCLPLNRIISCLIKFSDFCCKLYPFLSRHVSCLPLFCTAIIIRHFHCQFVEITMFEQLQSAWTHPLYKYIVYNLTIFTDLL